LDNTEKGNASLVKNKTSIIIATWNALRYFDLAIKSIKKYTPNDYELVVIDNGSKPDMVDYIKSLGCKSVFNSTNLGPGAAFNQGIKVSDGEYICLFNSDAEVQDSNWLNHLLITLNSDSSVGIVGPTCDNVSSEQVNHNLWGKEDYFIPKGHVMPFVCVIMRREIFKTVGLIAERFHGGCSEDSEFCTRLENSGYSKKVSAKSFIHHYLNQSFRDNRVDAHQMCYVMSQKLGDPEEIKYLVD
jgi:GT2 family glycosyltransferase